VSATGIQRALITGGAGFIGSHLADALLAGGVQVGIYANLSTGRRGFTEAAVARGASLHEADVLDEDALRSAMDGCDSVFHLQANATCASRQM